MGLPTHLAEAVINTLENKTPRVPDEWLAQYTTTVAVQKYIEALQITWHKSR